MHPGRRGNYRRISRLDGVIGGSKEIGGSGLALRNSAPTYEGEVDSAVSGRYVIAPGSGRYEEDHDDIQ